MAKREPRAPELREAKQSARAPGRKLAVLYQRPREGCCCIEESFL
jgi:hypothetical protein